MSERKPLFVRLPAPTAKKLDHFAVELGMSKQDVVADLVERGGLTVGRHAFFPHDTAEVLTTAEAAELLRSDEATVTSMADDGTLPGRKVGDEWRFTRAAILRWLGADEEE